MVVVWCQWGDKIQLYQMENRTKKANKVLKFICQQTFLFNPHRTNQTRLSPSQRVPGFLGPHSCSFAKQNFVCFWSHYSHFQWEETSSTKNCFQMEELALWILRVPSLVGFKWACQTVISWPQHQETSMMMMLVAINCSSGLSPSHHSIDSLEQTNKQTKTWVQTHWFKTKANFCPNFGYFTALRSSLETARNKRVLIQIQR